MDISQKYNIDTEPLELTKEDNYETLFTEVEEKVKEYNAELMVMLMD